MTMKTGYKLTKQDLTTHNGFQWEIGKTYKTSGEGELCGPGWLHYYDHPLLAILHNPVHARIDEPRLFEVELGKTIKRDRGMKAGTTSMRLVREIEVPIITTEQRVRYAIACSVQVCSEKSFLTWAENWVNGKDRTVDVAWYAAWPVAESAAWHAANYATWSAAESAAYAAESAGYATEYAAWYAARSTATLIKCAEWAVSTSIEIPVKEARA